MKFEYENVDSFTQRAKVFGGWIVKNTCDVFSSLLTHQSNSNGYEWRESICFVPDPKHEWCIKEIELCSVCKKPRIHIIETPCPHCGDEILF